MKLEDFDYALPTSLIAQYPTPRRGESRLMVLDRSRGTIQHQRFSNLLDHLRAGDLLVLNNTRVLPARLIGKKETGGRCELLVLPSWNGRTGSWRVLVKNLGKMKDSTTVRFEQGMEARLELDKDGRWEIVFPGHPNPLEVLYKIGHVPLPPYIKRGEEPLDRDRYQTVYAERDGSVAAPTAGLHFTEPLLQSIRDRGVKIAMLTLHVGIGTFVPVKVKRVEDHKMEEEWLEISQETAREIEEARKRGGRVIAVGTTTTRALESFANEAGGVRPGTGMTSLFIYPPFHFRVVDGLVTNFHLPRSTLLMLVSAFAGRELIMRAYEEAIERGYRFYSYGDAMLIL